MKILAIETSCDETAISIIDFKSASKFEIIFDSVLSQVELHKKYGGVFPALAKREHLKNIFPLLFSALKKNNLKKLEESKQGFNILDVKLEKKIGKILEKDVDNLEKIKELYQKYQKPKIDAIAVTYGPGLEMSLWAGFNIARAISEIWKIKLIPVNHMEGHIFAGLINSKNNFQFSISNFQYPLLILLISGGHTELILSKKELHYKILGQTLDDAVGEAYDKTARLLKLPYPGGPEISKLAEQGSKASLFEINLPRPMLKHNNFDFSFSGLKTAVLYLVKKRKKLSKNFKIELSKEFENAVSEVLITKTKKAILKYKPKTLIIGGGVSANNRLRKEFQKLSTPDLQVFLPQKKYTGDNALMIAIAGYFRLKLKKYPFNINKVNGNLKLK